MNTKLLLLASAAAFTVASCSSNNKTETATTTTTTDATATPPPAVDTLAYRNVAADLAQRVASDLTLADTTTVHKLKEVYYTRGRALNRLGATTDTTGRYAATKAANDQASASVKGILTAPQYTTYTTHEAGYYEGPFTATAAVTPTATAGRKPTLGERVGQGSGIKKLENNDDDRKVKYENGAKIKRSDDGSLKIKRADGTKIKIDEHGNRTVKKGLL